MFEVRLSNMSEVRCPMVAGHFSNDIHRPLHIHIPHLRLIQTPLHNVMLLLVIIIVIILILRIHILRLRLIRLIIRGGERTERESERQIYRDGMEWVNRRDDIANMIYDIGDMSEERGEGRGETERGE